MVYAMAYDMPSTAWSAQRRQRIMKEMAFALGRASRKDMLAWGARSAVRPIPLATRRIQGVGLLLKRLGGWCAWEATSAVDAYRGAGLGRHVSRRAAAGIDGTLSLKNAWAEKQAALGKAFRQKPKETATGLMAAVLGFYTGSGGLDGNGGVPDLDFVFWGIGEHRSIFTHSILAGVFLEAGLLAIVDLAGVIGSGLPKDHDSFWDVLATVGKAGADNMRTGLSAGIAYHLFVDGVAQPAPYKDLPFSMPMEGHQSLFVANAVVEGQDAMRRVPSTRPDYVDVPPSGPTTGEAIVAKVSDKLAHGRRALASGLGRILKG